MIASLLAVSVRQPRESANLHAGRQVESLHTARSHFAFVDVPANDFLFDTCYRSRRVTDGGAVPGSRLEVLCPACQHNNNFESRSIAVKT